MFENYIFSKIKLPQRAAMYKDFMQMTTHIIMCILLVKFSNYLKTKLQGGTLQE